MTPENLVTEAIEKSRDREPLVTAMALLYSARVLVRFDEDAAKEAFAEGSAIAEGLALDPRHRHVLWQETVQLGATADPIAALALYKRPPPANDDRYFHSARLGNHLVQSLAKTGHIDQALELLEDFDCEAGLASAILYFSSDPSHHRRAMLAARERWRRLLQKPHGFPSNFELTQFYPLFSQAWRKLGGDEARAWLEEILRAIETGPNDRTNARFGPSLELHSTRDMNLFHVLNVAAELKPPEELEAILRKYPDVEQAAKLYPFGIESIMAQRPPSPPGDGGGLMGAGGGRLPNFPRMMAAHRGDLDAIRRTLEEAHLDYADDMDPETVNDAPRVFWTSCHAYRQAMYSTGNSYRLGMCTADEAGTLLTQIPDTDFAIFGAIEFAAGALEAPQHSGWRIGQPRKSGNFPQRSR